jgi:hypothetical protein
MHFDAETFASPLAWPRPFRLRLIPNKTSQSSSGHCVASQPVLDLKNFIA